MTFVLNLQRINKTVGIKIEQPVNQANAHPTFTTSPATDLVCFDSLFGCASSCVCHELRRTEKQGICPRL